MLAIRRFNAESFNFNTSRIVRFYHVKSSFNWNVTSTRADCCRLQTRHFGIADTLSSYATQKIEQSKDKQFLKMIQSLANSPNWTLSHWKSTIDDQLNSWIQYIPGIGSSNEMTMLKKFKAILNALSDKELENHELINGPVRERVAAATSQSVEDVAKLLFFYKQTLVMHAWIQIKKQNQEPLPTNEFELMTMQESDPRMKDLVRKLTAKSKKTGRGRGFPF